MIKLPGYRIDGLLYQGERTRIFRALRLSDERPVSVKGLVVDGDPAATERLKREMMIAGRLSTSSVPAYLDYIEDGPYIVLQWVDGRSLDELLPDGGYRLDRWFFLAKNIFAILSILKNNGIIHGDVKPSNLVQRNSDGSLVLIDFGHAMDYRHSEEAERNYRQLDGGTPFYISPEQTGRMDRPVDFRSDLYSAGACLYELLLGRPPFTGNMLELVHAHLARRPIAPSKLSPDLPEPVSAIVMKLLEKMPEDRYSSAEGVLRDLEEAEELFHSGRDSLYFVPGRHDSTGTFTLSGRVYGREEELDVLHRAIERSRTPAPELLLVAGESGLGKSALMKEFVRIESGEQQPSWVFFGAWSEDDTAQSALISAAQDLVYRLLAAHESEILSWSSLISTQLAESLPILRRYIPTLPLIVGSQDSDGGDKRPWEESGELRSQLSRALCELFGIFSRYGEGLVLALDDIHLAARWELETIRNLLTLQAEKPILLLASYRPEALDHSDQLFHILSEVSAELRISTMLLRPLSREHIRRWLAESFGGEELEEIAAILAERLSGNPALIWDSLLQLQRSGGIHQDSDGQWRPDLGFFRKIRETGSIRSLLFRYLKDLNREERRLLTLFLCYSGKISRKDLSMLHPDGFPEDVLQRLSDYGFVRSAGKNEWIQIHRRLRDRLLGSISESMIQETHLRIARYLMRRGKRDPEAGRRALDHYSRAGSDKLSAKEAKRLLERAFSICEERIQNGDCDSGQRYLELIASLGGEQNDYFRHHHLRARCFVMCGRIEEGYEAYRKIILICEEPERLMMLYGELISALSLESRYSEALEVGRQGFMLADERFPYGGQIDRRLIDDAMEHLKIDTIERCRKAESPFHDAFLKMAVQLDAAVYSQLAEAYGDYIQSMMLHLMRRGGGKESAFIFALYALYLASDRKDYPESGRFGRAAIRMSDSYGDPHIQLMCRETYGAHVAPWVEPLSECQQVLDEGLRIAQAEGELLFSGFILMHRLLHEFFLSSDFHKLLNLGREYGRLVRTYKNREAIDQIDGMNTVCALFVLSDQEEIEDQLEQVEQMARRSEENGNYQAFVTIRVLELFYALLFRRMELAGSCVDDIERREYHLREHYLRAPYALASALLQLSSGRGEDKVEEHLQDLHMLENSCPENFSHLRLLLEAVLLQTRGKRHEAAEIFDASIDAARRRGDIFHTAIANELCGLFHEASERGKVAGLYFLESYRYWSYLGVQLRADQLRQQYGSLFPAAPGGGLSADRDIPKKDSRSPSASGSSQGKESYAVDTLAMLRAGRELTEALSEDLLIERMLKIILESTGAQSAFFILDGERDLLLRASYQPDIDGFSLYPDEHGTGEPMRLVESINLSMGLVRFTAKSGETVNIDDASFRGGFIHDPYFRDSGVRSVLCMPLPENGLEKGLIYLENRTIPDLFSKERVELVHVLVRQAAVSLQNARHYQQARALNRSLQEEILRRGEVEEGLRQAQKELKRLNEELEQRVEERTRDLTRTNRELKRSYQELQETQKQLIEAEKMASLGTLVAGIAHEVNTPLGVAVTAASFLQSEMKGKEGLEEQQETADLILRNLQRAGELIGSFKKVAVDQTSEALRRFELRGYVEDIVRSLKPQLKKSRVSVEVEIEPAIEANGYPGALSQIISNLIQNSLLHAFAPDQEGYIRISGRRLGESIEMEYIDDGKGMDGKTVKKIFDPFFTTRRGSGGSGLGMHIVYNLVKGKLSGSIECESTPGKGVCFRISFPLDLGKEA